MSENDKKKHCKRVFEFYEGKSLFMTGAAGYLGIVLLEVLLTYLPGIKNIFILLRSKKGLNPEERKNHIFKKRIFCKLLEKNPAASEKVTVIQGDVSHPNLGMSDEDFDKVTNEVSVIFHLAATISFLKSLRFTVQQNCVGLKNVIELARSLKKLEALVYTSTAYSNFNRHPVIEEMIYRLPWSGERFLKALECDETNEFEKLAADCKPEWPNHYCFSKCLAENIIKDMASDLPAVIIRPSIVAPCWKKSSLPGYIEEGFGLVDMSLAVGKGFAKVILGNRKSRFDLIPVDIVANAHVVAAWSIATERLSPTSVINCTGGPWNVSFGMYVDTMMKEIAFKELIPKSFREPSLVLVENVYLYKLLVLYEHYLPAYVFDAILALTGKKLRLVKLYKFMDALLDQMKTFLDATFHFKMDNYYALTEQMDPRDREIFYLDREELSMTEISKSMLGTCSFFDWTVTDQLSPEKRKQLVLKSTMLTSFIKRSTVLLLIFLIYLLISKMFF